MSETQEYNCKAVESLDGGPCGPRPELMCWLPVLILVLHSE